MIEPLNVMHRIFIRIILKNYYVNDKVNTNDLFLMLKILIVEQLYNKLSIIKIYLNKKEYELQHTTLMGNYYVNSGIKLFNQLPSEIKLIGNKIKFILKIKNVYK